jgi:hypothetical protein
MRLNDPVEFNNAREKQRCPEDKMAEDYGMACFLRAERWANLMEARMAADPTEPFEKLAAETERQAGREAASEGAIDEGLTGFMFGAVMSILAQFWTEGEALRLWHNERFGIKPEDDTGGVVNPAIITISTKG